MVFFDDYLYLLQQPNHLIQAQLHLYLIANLPHGQRLYNLFTHEILGAKRTQPTVILNVICFFYNIRTMGYSAIQPFISVNT